MNRYFIEVAYKGSQFAGFQVQNNGHSVQGAIDHALSTLMRVAIVTTGSSRTDAGVHAHQNFLHFDTDQSLHPQFLYKVNAILPRDIVLKGVYAVPAEAHARFAAESRSYQYFLYHTKDPFRQDRAYYYPYTLDFALLQQAAAIVSDYTDFSTFSKRNTQVKTYNCRILHSYWVREEGELVYHVRANRFLRGMVRGLVGTMLRVGRGKLSIEQFHEAINAKDCTKADFAVPPEGLFLMQVQYPEGLLQPVMKL
ncbi:tRNA pseudouridine(38-40) synthase TruA [Chitinophaga costaii]|nr:tRNA pseudouridine(38-40) synthase TruA [Chitinophaga costaii]PUZ22173.1 tRNA pseudouridine(38-40) synthase TruA [Chitinophaga costaii]